MVAFGGPVLALALDAVRDVEGQEPLSTLLTLFSKCKEQLQDGPRLENMCWRLWHQEHNHSYPALSDFSSSAGAASCSRSDDDSGSDHSDSSSEQDEHENDFWRINGFQSCSPISDHRPSCRRNLGASDAPSSRRSSSTASQKPGPLPRRSHSTPSPGKIMAELIPEKFVPSSRNKLVCESSDWSASTSTLNNQSDIIVGVALTDEMSGLHYSSPPAIKYDTVEHAGRLLPQLHIVNPTPHPTPPMTPQTTAPITAFSSFKQGQLAVPVSFLPLPLPLSTGKSPAPVFQSEALKSSSSTHGLFQHARVCSANERISLPLSPPVTATSNGSIESSHIFHQHHCYHTQAQLPVIDRQGSARPNGALSSPPRSSDHKFFIAQNGESPGSHQPDASGSSVVSGGNTSQSSNSHSGSRSQESHSRCRRESHRRRSSPRNDATDIQQRSVSNAIILPSSVTSTRSHGTTRSHASTGSSNANRSSRGTRKGREVVVRPGLRRANTHTTAIHHRQHVLPAHKSKLRRTNSSQSNAQLPAVAPAPLTQLQQQQEPVQPLVASAEVAAVGSSAAVPSKSSREKSRSPQKKSTRNPLRLTLASSSSSYETTDSDWTDEIEQPTAQAPRVQAHIPDDTRDEQQRRDMFAKVDRKSYTELSMKRTQSGLLSSLLRPEPATLQEGLYRMTRSTQDLAPHHSSRQGRYSTIPNLFQAGKSPAAGPVAVVEAAVAKDMQSGSNGRSKLRLKGRPEDEAIESDSEEDDADNTIQMSNSLAVQRLAALHGRRSSSTAPPSAVEETSNNSPPDSAVSPPPVHITAPIPVTMTFPYNLPPPVPPSTPRTTRRRMLSNELSESLRRNLLWERQQSKLRPTRRQTGVNIDGGVRPVLPSNSSSNVSSGNADYDSRVRDSREEERRKALARHRDWAAEYNGAGW